MTILNKPIMYIFLGVLLSCNGLYLGTLNAAQTKIKTGAFIKTIPLTGSINAENSERFIVPTTPNWRIQIKWMVKEGSVVKPGDPVVRFDTASLASENENIKMNVRDKEESLVQKMSDYNFQKFEQEVALKKSEIDLKKSAIDSSVPRGLESNFDYDKKQLNLKQSTQAFNDVKVEKQVKLGVLESEIKKLEIEIAEERAKLEKNLKQIESLVLTARTSGAVMYANNPYEDRKVAVDDSVFATMQVASIPDIDALQVEALMNETAVKSLRSGQKVNVRLDAYPNRVFTGVVKKVLNSAEEHKQWGNAHYFSVIIKLDKLDLDIMKPGMSVLCLVEVAHYNDVLLIPLPQVQYDGERFILYPKGQKPVSVNGLGFNEFYLALSTKEAAAQHITAGTLLLAPPSDQTTIKEQPNEKK